MTHRGIFSLETTTTKRLDELDNAKMRSPTDVVQSSYVLLGFQGFLGFHLLDRRGHVPSLRALEYILGFGNKINVPESMLNASKTSHPGYL
jgi:hypothetical protein